MELPNSQVKGTPSNRSKIKCWPFLMKHGNLQIAQKARSNREAAWTSRNIGPFSPVAPLRNGQSGTQCKKEQARYAFYCSWHQRMSEHQKETAFLRNVIAFDDSGERHKLEQKIGEAQRDERCVKRTAWLMAFLGGLGLAGLAYGTLFAERFPYGDSWLAFKISCTVGLAALISLVMLACFLIGCRQKLNRLREECRRLIMKVLESRLGHPHASLLREGSRRGGERATGQSAASSDSQQPP
jgi:hypothetical protein